MDMTFDDYIQNPMGVNSGVFTQREMYKTVYTDKLNKILVREMGKISYFLYRDDERYLIHLKIPSEVIDKFYYDVVIEFNPPSDIVAASNQLNGYNVKFYSNDPAFVFTFAYSFLKNNIFIKELVPRMSKAAVEKAAKLKNPKNNVGYVKSLYFAFLTIKTYGLMKKIQFVSYGKKYDLKRLLASIEPADLKISKRQQAQVELDKRKKDSKRKESLPSDNRVLGKVSKITKNITNTMSTKNTINKVNTIKPGNPNIRNINKSNITKTK